MYKLCNMSKSRWSWCVFVCMPLFSLMYLFCSSFFVPLVVCLYFLASNPAAVDGCRLLSLILPFPVKRVFFQSGQLNLSVILYVFTLHYEAAWDNSSCVCSVQVVQRSLMAKAHWCSWAVKTGPCGLTQQMRYYQSNCWKKLILVLTERCQNTQRITVCCTCGCRPVRMLMLTSVHHWKHQQWTHERQNWSNGRR